MLISTRLPKAVCSLKPLMIGRAVVGDTTGTPVGSVPALVLGSRRMLVDCVLDGLGKTIGASRMEKVPRPKVVAKRLLGSPGWATARPVVGSMLPTARLRSVTCALGSPPPLRGAASRRG